MVVFTELARRGLSHPKAMSIVKRAASMQISGEDKIEVPTWGFVLLYVSLMLSFVAISLVSYTLKEVVTTLCMVESPVAAITVSPSTQEPGDREEKEGLLETGPTITLVHQKPITSGIRSTLKHLVANAGRWARLRGIRIHFLYAFCFGIVAQSLAEILPRLPGHTVVVAALTGALCANLRASWTHKVVGMPSGKTFWERIPSRSHWKTLALPATVETAMPYISMYLTASFVSLTGITKLNGNDFPTYGAWQWISVALRVLAIFVFGICCTLFLCLPAIVTRVRIEASLLPEDEDTIVPFDRTFGGKVVSKLLGGTGIVSFLDAWRSFNWEARRRLLKLYVKTFFIMMCSIIVVMHLFVLELFVIMGSQMGKVLAELERNGVVTK